MSIRSIILRRLEHMSESRPADFIIGGEDHPYLLRWYVIPKNPVMNIYFHHFMRSDDDRALHDHPWASVSWILDGSYLEIVPQFKELWPVSRLTMGIFRRQGSVWARRAKDIHRIQLFFDYANTPVGNAYRELPVKTLFITGPRIREWGFWCPKGWKHWKDFTAATNKGEIGPGCEE